MFSLTESYVFKTWLASSFELNWTFNSGGAFGFPRRRKTDTGWLTRHSTDNLAKRQTLRRPTNKPTPTAA
uniref:Uncharacterized protein n=1 Tax=Caenorhabditis japonica TaxID=281687 RepID=A0A8R1HTW8_CAEJA